MCLLSNANVLGIGFNNKISLIFFQNRAALVQQTEICCLFFFTKCSVIQWSHRNVHLWFCCRFQCVSRQSGWLFPIIKWIIVHCRFIRLWLVVVGTVCSDSSTRKCRWNPSFDFWLCHQWVIGENTQAHVLSVDYSWTGCFISPLSFRKVFYYCCYLFASYFNRALNAFDTLDKIFTNS